MALYSLEMALFAAAVDNTYLLFKGSCIGLSLAILMALGMRLLTVREVITALLSGSRTLGMAVGVLFLAWAMASVCKGLGTGEYLKLMAPHIPALLLPIRVMYARPEKCRWHLAYASILRPLPRRSAS